MVQWGNERRHGWLLYIILYITVDRLLMRHAFRSDSDLAGCLAENIAGYIDTYRWTQLVTYSGRSRGGRVVCAPPPPRQS